VAIDFKAWRGVGGRGAREDGQKFMEPSLAEITAGGKYLSRREEWYVKVDDDPLPHFPVGFRAGYSWCQ